MTYSQPCQSSWAVSKAEVGSVIACPACGRPVRLKLMGESKFPGRYVGIPKHSTPEQHIADTNAKTNAAMTPREQKASENVRAAIAAATGAAS